MTFFSCRLHNSHLSTSFFQCSFQIQPQKCISFGCHRLDGVTRGGPPPPPSDATSYPAGRQGPRTYIVTFNCIAVMHKRNAVQSILLKSKAKAKAKEVLDEGAGRGRPLCPEVRCDLHTYRVVVEYSPTQQCTRK